MAAPQGLQRTISSKLPPERAMQAYLVLVTESFGKGRYFPTAQTPTSATFSKRQFHTWQIVVAILLFPIGLLALLAEKQSLWVSAVFTPSDSGGSTVTVTGAVPKSSDQMGAMLDYVENWIDSPAEAASDQE